MKLYGISNGSISTLKARLVEINGRKHYNLLIGSRGWNGWEYRIPISDNMVRNQFEDEYLLLDKDYSIRPIYKDDKEVVDKNGNKVYVLAYPTKPTLDKNALAVIYYDGDKSYKASNVEELGRGKEIVGTEVCNAGLFVFKNKGSLLFYGDDGIMYNAQNSDGTLTVTPIE